MKALQIHPRLLNFGIMILVLNLMISISTEYSNPDYTGINYFVNLTLPLWLALGGGFFIGFVIFLIPQGEFDTLVKMIRSQVFGVMIMSFILFVLYLYKLMALAAIQG